MYELEKYLKENDKKDDWMKKVGTKQVYHISGIGPTIALMDFGVKKNIINNLIKRKCNITVFPYNTSYEEIMNINPDGVLLSNGPGDPTQAEEAIEVVKKLINKIPTFGICLGHQILAIALGGKTYKMKYGHRGGNHGVFDIEKDKAYITSQNHGYCVDSKSMMDRGMIITHKNLNDDTVEGMKHKELPVFSIQFHPEGAPGPEDSAYLFDKFIDVVEG
jgi:carbamoyl-phosphate synthase small subunit